MDFGRVARSNSLLYTAFDMKKIHKLAFDIFLCHNN